MIEEFGNQIGASDAAQFAHNALAFAGFVPEEELPLGEFVLRTFRRENGLQCVGVVARVPHFGGDGHWRGREVLHLFEVEVHLLRQNGEFGHILGLTAWVRRNEIGNDLLAQVFLATDAVEQPFELLKLAERRLSHQVEHAVGRVFGCYFQSSADVSGDEFAGVLSGGLVALFVAGLVQQQVVAHTAANETFFDAWQRIDGAIDVEQGGMVCVEIRADLRMDARRSAAFLAGFLVTSAHSVHIRRRTA